MQSLDHKSETPNSSLNYPKLRLRRRVGLFNLLLGRFGFCNPRLSSHGITSMFCFCLNFRISLGSRQSSTTSSGQTSHRASNLWAAANLSGPGQTPACNSSSTLPDYNGGHRQNSKPVADGGSGPQAGGLGQDPAGTLTMPTEESKMQGNSVSSLF